VLAEFVELALQLAERPRGRSRSQPALQRLVKSLDLALGLRMSRRPVLLLDAEQRQEALERVAAAAEAGGVDAPIVGQRRGRGAVGIDRRQERGDDLVACDGLVRGQGEQVARVVVEPAQDLDVGPDG
jgi:hypothetical protein